MTMVNSLIILLERNMGSDRAWVWMKSERICKPCLVSIFVYIETASAALSFAVLGSCCIIFKSFNNVNKFL